MTDYQGLTIRFAGDASQLLATLRDINANTERTQTNLSRINSALKLDPTNPRAYTQQAKLMNTALGEQGEKLASLKSKQSDYQQRLERTRQAMERYEQAEEENTYEYQALSKAAAEYEAAIESLETQIIATEASMQKMGEACRLAMGQDVLHNTGFGQFLLSAREGAADLNAMGDALTGIGTKLTAITAGTALTLGRSVLNETEEYGNAISKVGGYLDITGAQLEEMSELALYWGKETQFSATEAADAMSELAKGGMTQAQIKGGALEATMQLAAAGGISMADAATVAINAINVFGLEAENAVDVADALAGAANASVAEIGDLASSFRYVSGWAGLADYSINDVSGALGLMADRGLQGEMAGTSLRNVLQRLAAPTGKAKDLMDEYGLAVYDSEGHMKDIVTIVGDLNEAFGDLDEETRNGVLNTIFGARGLPGAIALMEAGPAALEKYIAATKRVGYSAEMAQAQMGDLGWALEYLRGEAETAEVNLGTALTPALVELANAAEGALSYFNDMSRERQLGIAKDLLKVAAAGPALLVVGTALKAMGGATGTLASLGMFVSQLGTSLGAGATATQAFGEAVQVATDDVVSAARGVSLLKTSVALVGAAAAAFVAIKLWQAMEKNRKRTKNLNDVLERADSLLEDAGPSTEKFAENLYGAGDAAKSTAKDVDTLLESMVGFYDRVDEAYQSVETDSAMLNRADEIIQRLGGNTDLTEEEIQELAGALAYVNSVLGTNYALHSDTGGVIYDENDAVVTLTSSIHRLIEAQKAQIKANAIEGLLEDAYKQQYEAQQTLNKASEDYLDLLDRRNRGEKVASGEIERAGQAVLDAKSALDAADSTVEKLQGDYDATAEAAMKASQATVNAVEDMAYSIDGLSEKLDEEGVSVSDFAGLTVDEFNEMVEEAGGDVDALVGMLKEWRDQQPANVDLGFETEGAEEDVEALQLDLDEVRRQLQEIQDEPWRVEITSNVEDGVLYQFVDWLVNTALPDLTSEPWEVKVTSDIEDGAIWQFLTYIGLIPEKKETEVEVGGNLEETLDQEREWGSTYLPNQSASVDIDVDTDGNGTLHDVLHDTEAFAGIGGLGNHIGTASIGGNLAESLLDLLGWNKSKIKKQSGKANVDGNLPDRLSTLKDWNDRKLKNQTATASASGNLSSRLSDLKEWNRLGMQSKWGQASIAVAIKAAGSKASGFTKTRDGGMVYRHADGYITNHSIYSGNHVIGEAGIEAVLPLNNRAATQPLVDAIADGVSHRMAGGTSYNLYINDARVNDDPAIRGAFLDLMGELGRKGAMNVGRRD